MSDNLEYNLPNNAYANFDAVSLKAFMIERLNESGQFTDQNYEGSNISSIIEILAFYTHVLMFYLNQTSSESMFSQTSIYENMNKIVKLIEYRPTGKQTSLTSVECTANSSLVKGSYNIRKYSYFLIDGIQYTFIDDLPFEKTVDGAEYIQSINDNSILYQGVVGEYPLYTAEGDDFETIPVVVDNLVNTNDTRFISHGSISVYVKEINSDTWYEYEEVDNLFLSDSSDRVYDLRLNEHGHYEVKFGNGVFGRKLVESDEVAIFYILSDGDKGLISKNSINGNKLFNYNSVRFGQIYEDTKNLLTTTIDLNYSGNLTFNNTSNSTLIQEAESVDEIRQNSPIFLSTQIRLVTGDDYERFIRKSIPNIVNSIKVVDNDTFINQYIDYFYKICVDPNKTNRVILNQVNFADSCDFNNVNIFCVPSLIINTDESYPEFLSNSFKNLIIDITKNKKIISNEIVVRDPIYMAVDLGFTNSDPTLNTYDNTKLVIVREDNNKINKEILKKRVLDVITEYFDPASIELGQKIDMSGITSSILSIQGIKSIRTENTSERVFFNGLSFVVWNPVFEESDITLINQTTTLPFFKFPYLYRPNSMINKIEVIDE